MLSKLIVGRDQNLKKQKVVEILKAISLKIDSPDVLIFEEETKVGVEETKKVKEFLSIKPISPYKAVVFWDSNLISNIAQNALLKSVEDISENGIIIFVSHRKDEVIPTLLSRLELINLRDENVMIIDTEKVKIWVEGSIEERFKMIEGIDEKGLFFEQLGAFAEQNVNSSPRLTNFGKRVLEAEKYWGANGNQRAILEWLALELEVRSET